jgi:putative ABC transport system permease protein
VFESMAALRGRAMNLTGDGAAEFLRGNAVTPEFFPVMGVPALLGRTLDERDDQSGDLTVVISYSLWQRRYSGDRNIIGRLIQLSDESYTVVGVMPGGFRFPSRKTDFWIPAKFTPETLARRGSHFLTVVARLKPGVTWQRARADMDTIARRLQQDHPQTNERLGVVVIPLREEVAGDSRTGLIVLLSGAGFVLLIACANVANLLLARASSRQRELAVRTALGAGRGRLITQLITESVLLSAAGGLMGLAIARTGLKLLERLVPARLDRELTLNTEVLLFTLAISIVTGIVFGVIPALHASRLDLNDALKQGSRTNAGGRGGFYRDALVVAEVAMALVLLAAAGLMMKTLARLQAIDVGFKPEGLLTVFTNIPYPKYADGQKRLRHYDRVLEQVRVLPGVRSAAFVSDLPFTAEGNTNGFRIEGKPERPGGPVQDALYRLATNDYLKTLGVRLLAGRLPGEHDGQHTPPVVVINETFARTFFEGESAVGKRMNYGQPPWRTIIGVIADVRERGITPTPKPAMYIPLAQDLDGWAVADELVIRVDGNPLAIAPAVRAAMTSSDPDLPVISVQTMQEILDLGVASREQQKRLLMAFAGLALTLAGLGIYGVLSYLVVQRSREIGVRMALGASALNILCTVAFKGALLTAAGLVLGTAAALAITRAMRSMLYEVAPADAPTYAAVIATLMAIALIACAIPAVRAARVDPMVALRDE